MQSKRIKGSPKWRCEVSDLVSYPAGYRVVRREIKIAVLEFCPSFWAKGDVLTENCFDPIVVHDHSFAQRLNNGGGNLREFVHEDVVNHESRMFTDYALLPSEIRDYAHRRNDAGIVENEVNGQRSKEVV